MLHKLKVTSYWLIILFVLILPSQAVAQCLTQDECAAAADAQGLQQGGAGYGFAGPYGTKGCYSYNSGKYKGMAYFGRGGTESEMAAVPAPPKYRIPCGPNAAPTAPPTGPSPELLAAQARVTELEAQVEKAQNIESARFKGVVAQMVELREKLASLKAKATQHNKLPPPTHMQTPQTRFLDERHTRDHPAPDDAHVDSLQNQNPHILPGSNISEPGSEHAETKSFSPLEIMQMRYERLEERYKKFQQKCTYQIQHACGG